MERDDIIDEIIAMEYIMFDATQNEGGRAACQDDMRNFYIQRHAQFAAWPDELLTSYHGDLLTAGEHGDNLVTFKYAYMMAYTAPAEYEDLKAALPMLSETKKELMASIQSKLLLWHQHAASAYPKFASRGRTSMSQDAVAYADTSVEAYSMGELATYSEATLTIYEQYIKELELQGLNLAIMTYEHLARAYGYKNLEEAEALL